MKKSKKIINNPAKSFLFIGSDLVLEEKSKKTIANAKQHGAEVINVSGKDDLVRGIASLIESKSSDNSGATQVVFNFHGYETGRVFSFNEEVFSRNKFLGLLSHNKNADLDVYQFSCHAGAGLIRTAKDDSGNRNQEELEKSLPKNGQFTICAGKYATNGHITSVLLDNVLIPHHQLSPFVKKAELMFYPQTFKWFRKRADVVDSFKYDAPKPEKLIEDLAKTHSISIEEVSYGLVVQSYRNYIKSKIDEFRKIYTRNNSISESELKEIEVFIRSAKNQIDSNPKLISDYIHMDFLIAIHENKLERVDFYIKNRKVFGLDVNYNLYDYTPLQYAINWYKNSGGEVLRHLLEVDEDINRVDESGCTLLNKNCGYFGVLNVAKDLLTARNIDVNKPDKNGDTPLNTACFFGKTEIVKDLLEVDGIDVDKPNNRGCTPLQTACLLGEEKIVEELLKKIHHIENKNLSLANFVTKNKLELLQKLVNEYGVDINGSQNGSNLLRAAVRNRVSSATMTFLLDRISSDTINVQKVEKGKTFIQLTLDNTSSDARATVERLKTILSHERVAVGQDTIKLIKKAKILNERDSAEILTLIDHRLNPEKAYQTDKEDFPNPDVAISAPVKSLNAGKQANR